MRFLRDSNLLGWVGHSAKSFLLVRDLENGLIIHRLLPYCFVGSLGTVMYIGVLAGLVGLK